MVAAELIVDVGWFAGERVGLAAVVFDGLTDASLREKRRLAAGATV
jgi:hypothetical protein